LPYWAVFSADLRGPARPRQHQRATTRRGPCFSSVVPEVPHAKNLAAKVVAGAQAIMVQRAAPVAIGNKRQLTPARAVRSAPEVLEAIRR